MQEKKHLELLADSEYCGYILACDRILDQLISRAIIFPLIVLMPRKCSLD